MSNLMLVGTLRMPVSAGSDDLTLTQFIDRGRQAADVIEQQADRIVNLLSDLDDLSHRDTEKVQRIAELEALITQFMQTKTTGDMYRLFSAVDGLGASLSRIKANAVEEMINHLKATQKYFTFGYFDDMRDYANKLRNSVKAEG